MNVNVNESRLVRIAKSVAAKFGVYTLTDNMSKMNAAKNPRTPEYKLRELAEDDNEYVRMAVAENPSTPPDTLRMLADDDVLAVRHAASRNTSAMSFA